MEPYCRSVAGKLPEDSPELVGGQGALQPALRVLLGVLDKRQPEGDRHQPSPVRPTLATLGVLPRLRHGGAR